MNPQPFSVSHGCPFPNENRQSICLILVIRNGVLWKYLKCPLQVRRSTLLDASYIGWIETFRENYPPISTPRMKQLQIDGDALPGMPLYANLEVVVDYLLGNGNTLTHTYRWGSNREGYFCHVQKPIDFDLLIAKFQFPPTIVLGRDRNVIYCETTGCSIQTFANVA